MVISYGLCFLFCFAFSSAFLSLLPFLLSLFKLFSPIIASVLGIGKIGRRVVVWGFQVLVLKVHEVNGVNAEE